VERHTRNLEIWCSARGQGIWGVGELSPSGRRTVEIPEPTQVELVRPLNLVTFAIEAIFNVRSPHRSRLIWYGALAHYVRDYVVHYV